ncbi:hypothetical protein N6H14_07940 [Paenibacillus sp. CC-CFT747]|nr:hypothetical protein N6H14_07940 [Paenibacillus sp. CC-CFT747]
MSTALDQPAHYYETEAERYLKKPFTMERLLEVVRELLEKEPKETIVFPARNEQEVVRILQENGIGFEELKAGEDTVEVKLKRTEREEG